MSSGAPIRSDRVRTMWLGTATMAAITILAPIARKMAGADAAAVVAGVYGIGVLAMAWLTARSTAYPRWAWFASAGVLTSTVVVAAVVFPEPAQVKTWTSTAWMLPWLFLVFTLSPGPASGACSARSAQSGPLLIAVSVIYAVILLGACWLTR